MSIEIVWLLPIVCTIGLIVSVVNLGASVVKLSRQGNLLQKHLAAFKDTDHATSKESFSIKPATIEEATAKRRAFLKLRTKNKVNRQRRLVKRLRNLKSKESE